MNNPDSTAFSNVDTVLFDLDGTLSHSESGILGSLRHALTTEGIDVPTYEILRTAIGPPFRTGLPDIGVPLDRVEDVRRTYKTHYAAGGLLNTSLFPGIETLLVDLRKAEMRLAVATSKPESDAEQVVAHLGIAEHFDVVAGSDEASGRDDKAKVITSALQRLGVDPGPHVVMVGDRHHDIDGARANGIETIAVGWGYGSPEEHSAYGALAIAPTADDLGRLLLAS